MTYAELLDISRGLLNDQAGGVYTNAVLLQYLNLALMETQELFELNNIPSTNETSAVIEVASGRTAVGFAPDPPVPNTDYLPAGLTEIQRLWYSNAGQGNWFPVDKKDFLTQNELPNSTEVSYFGVWAWMDQEIRLLAANVDLDIKIDYIQSLFTALAIDDLDDDVTVINITTAVSFRIAGLASEFIGQNPSRASSLNTSASSAMDRSLGIATKGRQSIMTRRLPFRFSRRRR